MTELDWSYIQKTADKGNKIPDRRVEKSKMEWKALLPDEAFRVTREHGTERPGSSDLCHGHSAGKYACVCCDELLFDSSSKFDSGTGWPSFTAPVKDNVINYFCDESHGMFRIEVQCSVCDAHLGHVFPDGRGETGLRYCINGAALNKIDA